MCEPTTIMMGLSLASGALGAKSAYDQGQASKRIAENNATMAGYAAQDAQRRGEMEVQDIQRRAAALKSSQRVSLAAKGLDLGYGTAADLQDQTDFFAQNDAALARSNAGREVWSRGVQAQNMRTEGRLASYNGSMQAVGSLLGAAGQVSDKWHMYKKGG